MLIIILSYFLGAVPAGYLINRYFPIINFISSDKSFLPETIRRNVKLHGSKVLSIAADLLKGGITVWIVFRLGTRLSGSSFGFLIFPFVSPGLIHVGALISVVLGHVFSVYICGWGGRGVATALGGFLLLMPEAAIGSIIIFIIAAYLKKSIPFASIVASWALPVLIWYFYRMNVPYQIAAIFLATLSLITHYKYLRPETPASDSGILN